MALFGDIQIYGNPELISMSPDVNFQNFYLAMIMLFRISTGESWNSLMHDCYSGARCEEPPHLKECGNSAIAIVFFVSFMIIGSFVFVNLFIAVIIEKLFECDEEEGADDMSVMTHDLDSFVEAWSRIAPDGSNYIPSVFLPLLLQDVAAPLGFNGEVMRKSCVIRCISRLGIRDHGGNVHFVETLWRLASMVAGADMRNVAGNSILKNINILVIRSWPMPFSKDGSRGQDGVLYLAAQVIVASRIQSVWRAKKCKERFMMQVRMMAEESRLHTEYIKDDALIKQGATDTASNEDAALALVIDVEKSGLGGLSPETTAAGTVQDLTSSRDSGEVAAPHKDMPLALPKMPKGASIMDIADGQVELSSILEGTFPDQFSLDDPRGKLKVPGQETRQTPRPSLVSTVLSTCNTVPACMVGCAKNDAPCGEKPHTPPCEFTLASEYSGDSNGSPGRDVLNLTWEGPQGLEEEVPVQADSNIWDEDGVPIERRGDELADEVPPPSMHDSGRAVLQSSATPEKRQLLVL